MKNNSRIFTKLLSHLYYYLDAFNIIKKVLFKFLSLHLNITVVLTVKYGQLLKAYAYGNLEIFITKMLLHKELYD